jgi:hypothetical protein
MFIVIIKIFVNTPKSKCFKAGFDGSSTTDDSRENALEIIISFQKQALRISEKWL